MKTPVFFIGEKLSAVTRQWLQKQEQRVLCPRGIKQVFDVKRVLRGEQHGFLPGVATTAGFFIKGDVCHGCFHGVADAGLGSMLAANASKP